MVFLCNEKNKLEYGELSCEISFRKMTNLTNEKNVILRVCGLSVKFEFLLHCISLKI